MAVDPVKTYVGDYVDLLIRTDVDFLATLGAPEDEMETRARATGEHYKNLRELGINPLMTAPTAEAKMLREYLDDEGIDDYSVRSTEGKENRWDELAELGNVLEGDEEVHFFTSDYALAQDRIAVRNEFPDLIQNSSQYGLTKSTKVLSQRLETLGPEQSIWTSDSSSGTPRSAIPEVCSRFL